MVRLKPVFFANFFFNHSHLNVNSLDEKEERLFFVLEYKST